MSRIYLNRVGNVEFATEVPGWTTEKVTVAANSVVTIKTKPGLVYGVVVVTSGVSVTVMDGERQVWPALTGPVEKDFPGPLACATNISLLFSGVGAGGAEAWVVYR